MSDFDKSYWTIVASLVLGLALIFSACQSPPQNEVVDVQLTSENEGTITLANGERTVRYNRLHEVLAQMDVPRPRARQLLHSADQQQQAWRRAQATQTTGPTEDELLWLARAVHSETKRSREMELVASVIVNRIESPHYPNHARTVVKEAWQFTGIHKGTARSLHLSMADYEGGPNAWRRAIRISYSVLSLPDTLRPLHGVTHFYSPRSMRGQAQPDWARNQHPRYQIGNRFVFYDLSGG